MSSKVCVLFQLSSYILSIWVVGRNLLIKYPLGQFKYKRRLRTLEVILSLLSVVIKIVYSGFSEKIKEIKVL